MYFIFSLPFLYFYALETLFHLFSFVPSIWMLEVLCKKLAFIENAEHLLQTCLFCRFSPFRSRLEFKKKILKYIKNHKKLNIKRFNWRVKSAVLFDLNIFRISLYFELLVGRNKTMGCLFLWEPSGKAIKFLKSFK